jgi:hypothetical protein
VQDEMELREQLLVLDLLTQVHKVVQDLHAFRFLILQQGCALLLTLPVLPASGCFGLPDAVQEYQPLLEGD